MKKFLASLVLCVTLVAFAAPAFAGAVQASRLKEMLYHKTYTLTDEKGNEIVKCNCTYQFLQSKKFGNYLGPKAGCPYCDDRHEFIN